MYNILLSNFNSLLNLSKNTMERVLYQSDIIIIIIIIIMENTGIADHLEQLCRILSQKAITTNLSTTNHK